MQIDGLFVVNEQSSHDAAHFIGNRHEAFGFDGEGSRNGVGVNVKSKGFGFAYTHIATVVIELDALPFLGGLESFDAVAGHHDMHMVVDVSESVIPKEKRLCTVDEDVVELITTAEGIRVDLLHTGRDVNVFQERTLSKRMVTDVHNGTGQSDASKVYTTKNASLPM